MKKAYIIRQDRKLKTILNKTYNEAMAILKHRNPKARQLIEDEELSQLHDLLALLRLGHIRISNADPGGHLKTGQSWPGQNRPAAGRVLFNR